MDTGGAHALLLDSVAALDGVPSFWSADVHESAIGAEVADSFRKKFARRLLLGAVLLYEGELRIFLVLLALEASLLGGAWAGFRLSLPWGWAAAIGKETFATIHRAVKEL